MVIQLIGATLLDSDSQFVVTTDSPDLEPIIIAAAEEPDAVLTTDTLTRVYEHPIRVTREPDTGRRLILPMCKEE